MSLAAVRSAQEALELTQEKLRRAVREARDDGATWAEIGDVLDITRQAAFKRFGSPRDPRTGDRMTMIDSSDLIEVTERAFTLIDAGDYDSLRELIEGRAARTLSRAAVLGVWADVVAATGNLERCAGSRVELPDGTAADPGAVVLAPVTVATTLECEAGTWCGRMLFDSARRIIGILVLPPGARNPPW